MKKLFLFISFLILLSAVCFPQPVSASAEESVPQYAVADGKSIWFYSEPNEESGLFILPYTYYVLVISEGQTYCAVRYLDDVSPYKAITGYCKTEELTFVDFIPERPYLRKELTVTYSITNSSGFTMGNGSFDTLEKTYLFYGTSYLGTARFYYVYSDGVFDYIPATQEITYELNTDYLTAAAAGTDSDAEPSAEGVSVLQIVVICLIVAAVVAVALFVLRGKKPVPQDVEF